MTPTIKRKLLAVLFFSWLVALLALTYWPNLGSGKIDEEGFRVDYLGHFGFYALLIFFFLLWQHSRGLKTSMGYMLQATLLGIALGAVTELSQQLIPGRSLNPVDMLFNCLGIVAGAVAAAILFKGVGHRA